jgi:glycosyltransferase involved in cell wall biosynthesis
MKVLFLSTSDLLGGAAIAAHRLFRSVANLRDVRAEMLVQWKASSSPNVRRAESDLGKLSAQLRLPLENLLLRLCHRNAKASNFMAARLPDSLREKIKDFNPDILHLHWVGHAFMRPETLRGLKCPIVWTLHDMSPLTGGCYYSGECEKYKTTCGNCPVLVSTQGSDLSTKVMSRKRSAWSGLNLTIVSPSRWLASCAASSSLHSSRRIEVIPYGISKDTFQPWPRSLARRMLGLPCGVNLVLFGAVGLADPRKGFSYLQAALRRLRGMCTNLQLVVFGGELPQTVIDELGVPVHTLGKLGDELTTAIAYSAADIFVAPSLEDNLPNTVLEASMCGRPVVAFKVGGIPDIVEDGTTGILVEPRDSDGLARAIYRLSDSVENRVKMGSSARAKALKHYSSEVQVTRYHLLYKQLLECGKQLNK